MTTKVVLRGGPLDGCDFVAEVVSPGLTRLPGARLRPGPLTVEWGPYSIRYEDSHQVDETGARIYHQSHLQLDADPAPEEPRENPWAW